MSSPSQASRGFEGLPTELQLKVLKYAATPVKPLNLGATLFLYIGRYWESVFFPVTNSYHASFFEYASPKYIGDACAKHDDRVNVEATVAARLALMATCRLSRQVALEAWKKDLVGCEKCTNDIPESRPTAVYTGKKVAELLDRLIELTKHGKATRLDPPPPRRVPKNKPEEPASTNTGNATSKESSAAKNNGGSRSSRGGRGRGGRRGGGPGGRRGGGGGGNSPEKPEQPVWINIGEVTLGEEISAVEDNGGSGPLRGGRGRGGRRGGGRGGGRGGHSGQGSSKRAEEPASTKTGEVALEQSPAAQDDGRSRSSRGGRGRGVRRGGRGQQLNAAK